MRKQKASTKLNSQGTFGFLDRLFKNKFALIVLLGGVLLVAYNSYRVKTFRIYGRTMGTTYSVTIMTRGWHQADAIKRDINAELERYNQVFSTYIPSSEISRFNRSTPNVEVMVSDQFRDLTIRSKEWAQLTNGAFDPTIKPLLDLWPFSPDMKEFRFPSKDKVETTLKSIGMENIQLTSTNALKRRNPIVTVDYSAVAKGDGVDQIVALLDMKGYRHFMVEIGGEIFARGAKPNGEPWKVGINTPRPGSLESEFIKVAELENLGMATSGDYRNFITIKNKNYSHIIDPRSGYPLTGDVVSVTVIASSAAKADALATALMVLGPEEKWLKMANTRVLFILKDGADFKFIQSDNWPEPI